ncbi:MAG TPA: PIN domain-containing protein [Nitrospiria bacterium]|nr:PIN domain-containing protein [Nitrospiria bacterium]
MWSARIVLVFASLVLGAVLARGGGAQGLQALIVGLAIGLALAAVPLGLDALAAAWSWQRVAGSVLGGVAGIAASGVVLWATSRVSLGPTMARYWPVAVLVALGYAGWRFGGQWAAMLMFAASPPSSAPRMPSNVVAGRKLLDTSVIIDGRVADLCDTGFLEGNLLVPQFILQELQHIADSSDTLKRARGRRGLDILHRIQNMPGVTVTILDEDVPQVKDVDAKLVALAKKLDAKIVTNDLNLNKVAGLQGVRVLNTNELSNALRPVVLPGEPMRVLVQREGKETGQGVAYLDDGTMIVVDDGRKYIGRHVEVVVTSVLQTAAGRMIFTRLREDADRGESGVRPERSLSA